MTVNHYLVHQMVKEIRAETGTMASNPEIRDLLQEDPETEIKRADLQRRKDNLENAMRQLRKF